MDVAMQRVLEAMAHMKFRLTAALAGSGGEQVPGSFSYATVSSATTPRYDGGGFGSSAAPASYDDDHFFDDEPNRDEIAKVLALLEYNETASSATVLIDFSDGARTRAVAVVPAVHSALKVFDQMLNPGDDGEPMFDEEPNDSIAELVDVNALAHLAHNLFRFSETDSDEAETGHNNLAVLENNLGLRVDLGNYVQEKAVQCVASGTPADTASSNGGRKHPQEVTQTSRISAGGNHRPATTMPGLHATSKGLSCYVRVGVREVDRACAIGGSGGGRICLFMDLLDDPLCRIRCPSDSLMLAAETATGPNNKEITGVVRGCDKFRTPSVLVTEEEDEVLHTLPNRCSMNCSSIRQSCFSPPFSGSWEAVLHKQPWPPPAQPVPFVILGDGIQVRLPPWPPPAWKFLLQDDVVGRILWLDNCASDRYYNCRDCAWFKVIWGLDDNLLCRWDMRDRRGIVQKLASATESPVLQWTQGHQFSRGTNFQCFASTGDGSIVVGSLDGKIHWYYKSFMRMAKTAFPGLGSPITHVDVTYDGKWILGTTDTYLILICTIFIDIDGKENFFLLRGNHECASVNHIYGSYDECKRRFSVKLWQTFTDCFKCLPVSALIDEKILCMHGGLSPELNKLEQLLNLNRPTDVPDTGLLCELLWSDPSNEATGWAINDRGVSFTLGPDKVAKFLLKANISPALASHSPKLWGNQCSPLKAEVEPSIIVYSLSGLGASRISSGGECQATRPVGPHVEALPMEAVAGTEECKASDADEKDRRRVAAICQATCNTKYTGHSGPCKGKSPRI